MMLYPHNDGGEIRALTSRSPPFCHSQKHHSHIIMPNAGQGLKILYQEHLQSGLKHGISQIPNTSCHHDTLDKFPKQGLVGGYNRGLDEHDRRQQRLPSHRYLLLQKCKRAAWRGILTNAVCVQALDSMVWNEETDSFSH